MELKTATDMLMMDHFNQEQKEQWADLGCGSGTFTLALAGLLRPQSIIYAMDKEVGALRQIPSHYHGVTIEKVNSDFNKEKLTFRDLNGILMANSLHYIPDQYSFIQQAAACLQQDGCFLLVEYDTETANTWVPYPLSYASLTKLFKQAGFSFIRKLKEKPSLFGRTKLYSVMVQR